MAAPSLTVSLIIARLHLSPFRVAVNKNQKQLPSSHPASLPSISCHLLLLLLRLTRCNANYYKDMPHTHTYLLCPCQCVCFLRVPFSLLLPPCVPAGCCLPAALLLYGEPTCCKLSIAYLSIDRLPSSSQKPAPAMIASHRGMAALPLFAKARHRCMGPDTQVNRRLHNLYSGKSKWN